MEKRLFLAILFSLLVLFIWSGLVPQTQRPLPLSTNPPLRPQRELPESLPLKEELLSFPQEEYEVIFDASRAVIKEVIFKNYKGYRFFLNDGFWLDEENLIFQPDSISSQRISFLYQDSEKKIIKEFIFSNHNYHIELSVKIENLSSLPLRMNLPLLLGRLDFTRNQAQLNFQDVTISAGDKIWHLNGRREQFFNQLQFIGLRDKYFCALIQPAATNSQGYIKKKNAHLFEMGLLGPELFIEPEKQREEKFSIYLGPQELSLITLLKPEWSAIVHYGTFDFVGQLLMQILQFFYRFTHNWGWAIIILSLAIYLLFYPLSLKQMHSMKQMQELKPQVEALRLTYKDNPQRLNKEILELYRRNKVNPLGGCLPLLLQMPIFIALYQVLNRFVELKGASFFWIKDLSEPDHLFILPIALPIKEINILPIVMAIGMYIQQRISPVAMSAETQGQQKLYQILFPLLFLFIFYNMPSGLVLYWLMNSALMLFYQLKMRNLK